MLIGVVMLLLAPIVKGWMKMDDLDGPGMEGMVRGERDEQGFA
jgi:hypothetical protein